MPKPSSVVERSRNRIRSAETSLSRRTDLRTGHALWPVRRLPRLPVCPLRRDLRIDVLVVGAGISGALVAEALTDAGLSVFILDRRGPLQGSTVASTCLLQYELDVALYRLARQIGRADAERIWRRTRLSVDALRERARHLSIQAGIENHDALELEGTVLDENGLRAETIARRRAGFEVTFLTRREVCEQFGIRRRAAILGYDNCIADPRQLAAGFLHTALKRGARLYSPTEVTDLTSQTSNVIAETRQGLRSVHATSY